MDKKNYKIFSSVSDLSEESQAENQQTEKIQISQNEQQTSNIVNNNDCKNEDTFQKQQIQQNNQVQKFIEKYSKVNQLGQNKQIVNTQKKNEQKMNDREQQIKQENKVILSKLKQQNQDTLQEENSVESEFESQELDEDEEYKKWRIRELQRIKRDKLQRIENQNTPNANLQTKNTQKQSKSDYKYMQKYYKSMTFFQNEDDPIYKRDYNVAVGFDTFDKSSLPKYLQVRGDEFGKKGRSKYKDLITEDTNTYDNYYNVDSKILKKLKKT